MRILYITSVSLEKEKNTGNKIHFTEVGKALKSLGNEIILIAPRYENLGSRYDYGLIDEQMDFPKRTYVNYLKFHNRLGGEFKSLIDKYSPDFVYSRDIINGHRFYKILKPLKIPYMIEINDIIANSDLKPDLLKMILASNQFKQIGNCDAIRVMLDQTAEKIRNKIPEKKVFTIPHGTDTDIFKERDKLEMRSKYGFGKDDYIYLFVGTFNSESYVKGLKSFIEAFHNFYSTNKNIKAIIVGDGKNHVTLKEIVRSKGLDEMIFFTGYIQNDIVPEYISLSDICLQVWVPERDDKVGLSLKLSSYMACGRRILLSDIEGFREITSDFDPILWNYHDEHSMRNCLVKAYEEKDIWCKGKEQRKFVEENYTWKISAKRIVNAAETIGEKL